MDINEFLSDEAVLAELGERLGRYRLQRELTQAELAREAGVSKRTVERLEAGASVQLQNLVRVLRVLDLLANVEQAVPEPGPSPLDAVKLQGRERQRASSKAPVVNEEPWTWGDDDEGGEGA